MSIFDDIIHVIKGITNTTTELVKDVAIHGVDHVTTAVNEVLDAAQKAEKTIEDHINK